MGRPGPPEKSRETRPMRAPRFRHLWARDIEFAWFLGICKKHTIQVILRKYYLGTLCNIFNLQYEKLQYDIF